MLNNEFIYDNWNIHTKDEATFADTLSAMTKNSVWEAGISSKNLRARALMGPIEGEMLVASGKYNEAAVRDTCEGSRLMLQYNGKEDFLRNCAFSGLLDAARIKGGCFRDMPPEATSAVVNTALQYARGSSLLLHRGEKITAVVSDAGNGYRVLEQDKLYSILTDGIRSNGLGIPSFLGGSIDHEFTYAMMDLPTAQKALTKLYENALQSKGRKEELMPVVKFSTSDVRNSSATLVAGYRLANRKDSFFTMVSPLKVDHRRSKVDGLTEFEGAVSRLYARFRDTEETIQAMSNTWIHYPLNAYILMTQKVGLAKKYAKDGYEDLERYTGGSACSMYDLYMSMVLANETARKAGLKGLAMNNVEDMVAAVLALNWTDFDVPGTVAWNAVA